VFSALAEHRQPPDLLQAAKWRSHQRRSLRRGGGQRSKEEGGFSSLGSTRTNDRDSGSGSIGSLRRSGYHPRRKGKHVNDYEVYPEDLAAFAKSSAEMDDDMMDWKGSSAFHRTMSSLDNSGALGSPVQLASTKLSTSARSWNGGGHMRSSQSSSSASGPPYPPGSSKAKSSSALAPGGPRRPSSLVNFRFPADDNSVPDKSPSSRSRRVSRGSPEMVHHSTTSSLSGLLANLRSPRPDSNVQQLQQYTPSSAFVDADLISDSERPTRSDTEAMSRSSSRVGFFKRGRGRNRTGNEMDGYKSTDGEENGPLSRRHGTLGDAFPAGVGAGLTTVTTSKGETATDFDAAAFRNAIASIEMSSTDDEDEESEREVEDIDEDEYERIRGYAIYLDDVRTVACKADVRLTGSCTMADER
jgi:hypothetical protein